MSLRGPKALGRESKMGGMPWLEIVQWGLTVADDREGQRSCLKYRGFFHD